MKNEITMHLRRFPVLVQDHHTGEKVATTITLDKSQLQAAQTVGQSNKELIDRLCDRQGCTALKIGKPHKLSITIDLAKLVKEYEK